MMQGMDTGIESFRRRYERDRFVEYSAEESRLVARFEQCLNCGLCLNACEVLRNLSQSVNQFAGPRSLAISLSRSPSDFWAAADTVYYCTMCGACEAVCPSQIPIPEIVAMIRAKVPRQAPDLVPEAHAALVGNLTETGNIYGERLEPLPHRRPEPDYVFFAGCVGSHLERESIENTLRLLDRLGVRFTTVDEICCGGPAKVSGAPMVAALVEHNLEAILATGTNRVITSCPRCYETLGKHPAYAGKLEVTHITSFLAGFDWTALTNQVVTFHDPCELGRQRGEYDSPRQVLHQAAPGFTELPNTREHSVCCGAGGGVRGMYTRLSVDIARQRVEEAMQTGASVLLTECCSCLHNFKNARRRKDPLELYSLSEYLNLLLDRSRAENSPAETA